MTQQRTIHRLNPSEETIRAGELWIRFLVTGADSAGGASVFEMNVSGGDKFSPPPHSHDAYEETIYGVTGTLTWTVDGDTLEVGPGQTLCIPRGAVHRFTNHGDVDARALAIITPAILGPQYFRDVAEAMKASAGGPPDRAKIAEIMRRHGLTPAPPPGA